MGLFSKATGIELPARLTGNVLRNLKSEADQVVRQDGKEKYKEEDFPSIAAITFLTMAQEVARTVVSENAARYLLETYYHFDQARCAFIINTWIEMKKEKHLVY